MKKVDYTKEIKEGKRELDAYNNLLSHPKSLERLEILLWLKIGQVTTMKAALELKGRSSEYGRVLWKNYKSKGLEYCLGVRYNPNKSPLSDKKELTEKLLDTGFTSIKEAQEWILKTYGIKYTENGLGNYFRSRGTKLKTGRPSHPDRDNKKRSDYKKSMIKS